MGIKGGGRMFEIKEATFSTELHEYEPWVKNRHLSGI